MTPRLSTSRESSRRVGSNLIRSRAERTTQLPLSPQSQRGEQVNINEQVRFWARNRPEQEAIICNNTTLTWAEVDAEVDAVARGLLANGVRKGDRVSILMRNRIETAVSMLAAVRVGAICAPLNFRLLGKELAAMVQDCDPVVILAEGELAGLLEESAQAANFKVFATDSSDHPSYESLKVESGDKPDAEINESDIAFICYTSGTTGTQKGAVLTHRSIFAVAEAATLAHNITGRDRVLAAAPLVYTGSGISVFMQLVVYPGATMVLLDNFDPERGLDALVRHRITAMTIVPVIWERLAMMPEFEAAEFADFNLAGAGGAPVRIDLLERFRKRGIPLTQVYGCTEASGLVASMRYEDAVKRPGFAGLPLLGTDIKITALNGETAEPGEVGEVKVKGPHVMQGYWKRPEATAEVIDAAGWLSTGDLGLQDEEGFLQLVDRSKDMVISGGINVYPAEIERALAQVEGVLELAVIGVPDEKWGEVPMVVLRIDGDQQEVIGRLARASNENLAKFKRPTHALVVQDEIPRTFSGKLAKPVLRRLYPARPENAIELTRV
jgi:fatty-acyl-CoA synthase